MRSLRFLALAAVGLAASLAAAQSSARSAASAQVAPAKAAPALELATPIRDSRTQLFSYLPKPSVRPESMAKGPRIGNALTRSMTV
jgi:hypothetical protein